MTDATTCQMPAATPPFDPDVLVQARIRAEYREMPGMRLSVAQAARLFNLSVDRCARVLSALVEAGELWTNGRVFISRGAGRRFA